MSNHKRAICIGGPRSGEHINVSDNQPEYRFEKRTHLPLTDYTSDNVVLSFQCERYIRREFSFNADTTCIYVWEYSIHVPVQTLLFDELNRLSNILETHGVEK